MHDVELDPTAAWQALQQDPELRVLDVRTDPEYRAQRLPNSVLIPMQELPQRVAELDATAAWLVVCAHGVRSEWACTFLRRLGFARVRNLTGGLARWHQCGLPFEG